MSPTLPTLLQKIATLPDQAALRTEVTTTWLPYFAAKRGSVFFHSQLAQANPRVRQLFRLALSTQHNPVLRYLIERHAPVHEGLVTSPQAWRLLCPRADHWHVLLGPIVHQGQLIGGVGFTRAMGMPGFDSQNLADLSALCVHLSNWVASHPESGLMPDPVTIAAIPHTLTNRERQIAELVAQGHTNAEIGATLWITENSVKQALKRMFRKLEVTSRAELVACVYRQG
jgi:DNA-binding CsgD family transcriptional regulator